MFTIGRILTQPLATSAINSQLNKSTINTSVYQSILESKVRPSAQTGVVQHAVKTTFTVMDYTAVGNKCHYRRFLDLCENAVTIFKMIIPPLLLSMPRDNTMQINCLNSPPKEITYLVNSVTSSNVYESACCGSSETDQKSLTARCN